MNRNKFIKELQKMWKDDGNDNRPLTIEDLLDDCSCMGLDGASEAYIRMLEQQDINTETGNID